MKKKNSRRSFLKKSIGVAATLGFSGILTFEAWGMEGRKNESYFSYDPDLSMEEGFAADITPKIGMEQPDNYGKSYHKTFHDPCKVRAAVFNDGHTKVALIGIDALAVYQPMVDNVRTKVYDHCGISPEAILIGASHYNSSGP